MPRPGVGNPGNKGGGRKSFADEKVRAAIIENCWNYLGKVMDGGTAEQKYNIALKICTKNTPQDLDMTTGGVPFKINIS